MLDLLRYFPLLEPKDCITTILAHLRRLLSVEICVCHRHSNRHGGASGRAVHCPYSLSRTGRCIDDGLLLLLDKFEKLT